MPPQLRARFLRLPWQRRLVVDQIVLTAFVGALWQQDAPGWAFILLVGIWTRSSAFDVHTSLGALQGTVRASAESVRATLESGASRLRDMTTRARR